ncbi:hypothetical protein QPK14_00470 [Photorhabdus temperata subsp. temperata]
MSLFFSFINESNDIFKQRELSYHLNSFDINNRILGACPLSYLVAAGGVALITAGALMVTLG